MLGSISTCKVDPVEVSRPFTDVKGKFEFHIGRECDKIVLIIRSVDAANDTVGAQSHSFDLVAAFDHVVLGQEAGGL